MTSSNTPNTPNPDTPEDFIIRNIYLNTERMLRNVPLNDSRAAASILVLGIRMGISLHFRRPEAAETILQAIRIRTGSITYNPKNDAEIRMIEIILGEEVWRLQTPVPTAN